MRSLEFWQQWQTRVSNLPTWLREGGTAACSVGIASLMVFGLLMPRWQALKHQQQELVMLSLQGGGWHRHVFLQAIQPKEVSLQTVQNQYANTFPADVASPEAILSLMAFFQQSGGTLHHWQPRDAPQTNMSFVVHPWHLEASGSYTALLSLLHHLLTQQEIFLLKEVELQSDQATLRLRARLDFLSQQVPHS